MGSNCYALLILLCAVLYPGNATKILCALNSMDTPGELPVKIQFPPLYTATVRYSQWNKTSALIKEEKQNASWRFSRISPQDTTNYIVGNTNVTFNATQCSVLSNASTLDSIYGIPEQVKRALGISGYSVSDIVNTILHTTFTKKMYANDTVVVGGIETVQWIGCQALDDNVTAMQVEVAFAGTDSMAPYSRHIQNPIALSIHLLIYNETDLNVTQHVSFDIVEMDVPQTTSDQHILEMPRGMYCDGMEPSEPQASLPRKFEASFDYTDLQGNTVHDVDMLYDTPERVVSFRVDVTADRDAPFLGNATLPKDFTSVTVVHDFKYGLQYIVDAASGVCKELKAINQDFGDVEMLDTATVLIDIKSPVQLIMNISHSNNTYYAGKRISEEGVAVDVFVSHSVISSDGSHSVIEMLFTTSPWLFDTSPAPVLYSVIQYHKNSSGAEIGRSVLRMHALRNASAGVTRWSLIPAYTCLRFVEDSYLYVNIKNCSMDALEKIGMMEVQSALRETIAHTAGVSVLRVTKFFFKQVMNQVVAFFIIGEASGVAPANTINRLNESSALEARDLLNTTLMANDIKFIVTGASKTELSLARTSLGVIPSQWSPPAPPAPSFQGYTGGSMFVMALFMLMLGTGLGVGGMFLLWKRQRLSGLAYQVFE